MGWFISAEEFYWAPILSSVASDVDVIKRDNSDDLIGLENNFWIDVDA